MLEAQVLSDSQSLRRDYCRRTGIGRAYPGFADSSSNNEAKLEVLANALYCFTIALPPRYRYQHQSLRFARPAGTPATARALANDCAVYSIHMMIQLTRLLIHRRGVIRCIHQAVRPLEMPGRDQEPGKTRLDALAFGRDPENRAWSEYLDSADNILAVIRSSSTDHVRYVNPFMADTIWLAATAQVAGILFGPPSLDHSLAESNVDLLRAVFTSIASF